MTWCADVAAAQALAKSSGALVAIHFHSDDRPLVRQMDEQVLRAGGVVDALKRFANVLVDPRREAALYERTVGGAGALATCIADAAGEPVSVLMGYAEPADFLRFLSDAERGYPALRKAREAGAPFELAEALAALGCARRAQERYEEAASRGHVAAHERLGRLLVLRGRNVEARDRLRQFREKGGDDPARTLFTEALACSVERKPAEALGLLEEALRRFGDGPEADQMMLVHGGVLHEAGQDARATAALQEMIRRFPDSRWAGAARRQIEHIASGAATHGH